MNKKNLLKIINKELTILSDFVEGFNDSGNIHPKEVDLALSKASDIYEELLLLKGDEVSADSMPETKPGRNEEFREEKERDNILLHKISESKEVNEKVEVVSLPNEKTVFENKDQLEPIVELSSTENTGIKEADAIVTHEQVVDSITVKKPENMDSSIKNNPVLEESKKELDIDKQVNKSEKIDAKEGLKLTEENVVEQKKKTKTKGEIVADKFSNESPSINDMLASIKKNKDLASRLKDSPVKNLKKAIKLNDRIWYINELFNRNGSTFEKAVDIVNQSPDLDQALEYLFTNFSWDQNRKSTISFLELVFRRFASK